MKRAIIRHHAITLGADEGDGRMVGSVDLRDGERVIHIYVESPPQYAYVYTVEGDAG